VVSRRIKKSRTWLWRHARDRSFPAPRELPGGRLI
jgi:predicted DNA-binding transcriptional regulator AlpA